MDSAEGKTSSIHCQCLFSSLFPSGFEKSKAENYTAETKLVTCSPLLTGTQSLVQNLTEILLFYLKMDPLSEEKN